MVACPGQGRADNRRAPGVSRRRPDGLRLAAMRGGSEHEQAVSRTGRLRYVRLRGAPTMKTIVFCADGTWNGPGDSGNSDKPSITSNVFKLFVNLDGEDTP